MAYLTVIVQLQESVRNVYNVLRLRATDRTNSEDYKGFRLHIKNQLYANFRVSRLVFAINLRREGLEQLINTGELLQCSLTVIRVYSSEMECYIPFSKLHGD